MVVSCCLLWHLAGPSGQGRLQKWVTLIPSFCFCNMNIWGSTGFNILTAGNRWSKKHRQSSGDSTEQYYGSGLFRKLGSISSGCWKILYGLYITSRLPGLILVSSVIWRHSCWETPLLHSQDNMETFFFPSSCEHFSIDHMYASQMVKKDVTK